MSLESLPLIVGSFIVPSACFLGNIVIRSYRSVLQSSGADLLLLLVIFDLNVLIDADPFKKLIKDIEIQNCITSIFALFIIIEFILWPLCIVLIESKLRPQNIKPQISWFWKSSWFFSWSIIISITVCHILIFTLNKLEF